MLLILKAAKFTPIFTLLWINLSFLHASPSLSEALIFSNDDCRFNRSPVFKPFESTEDKQDKECSKWMLQTASLLGDDLDPSDVSVVIVAHNEKEFILRNTIKSLIANTSHSLLKEVIIVDDYSQPSIELKSETFEVQVFIIRNTVREGLIRSRLIGASEASGRVLVFADSHIRFAKNWLEPLVLRLLSIEHLEFRPALTVLSPFISAFTEDGRNYPAADYLRGGFDWDLTFMWEPMSDEEKDNLNAFGRHMNLTWLSLPRPSPVIAGSVVATIREHFIAFGAFDSQMQIWGGENIELSLRAWMCGGRVEIIPCSHVSHLFRNSHGYSFPEGKLATIMRNLKRVAMVWMQPSRGVQIDSARYSVPPIALFYSSQQDALRVSVGDLTSRERLKHRLGCKDFAWFVENIYPDLRRKGNEVKLKDNAMIKAQCPSILSKLK